MLSNISPEKKIRSHSIDASNSSGVGGGSNSKNDPSSTNNVSVKTKGRASKKRGSNIMATPDPIDSPSVISSHNNSSGLGTNLSNSSSNCQSLSHNVGQNITMHGTNNLSNNNNSSSSSSGSNNSDLVNVPASSPASSAVHPASSSSFSHATSKKLRRMSTIESSSSPSTSRTPEVMYSSSSSSGFSGLKFGYESQTPASSITQQPSVVITQPTIKDSPPSSPGSEIGTKKPAKKQKTGSSSSNTTISVPSPVETKENKLFHNGVHAAAHMLGNQLNPNSSMAPKLTDTLNMEIEAHIANATPLNDQSNLVGPTYPGKLQAVKLLFH